MARVISGTFYKIVTMTVYYDVFLISQENTCMLFKSEFNQFSIKKVHSCKSTGTSCDLLIATSLQLCC